MKRTELVFILDKSGSMEGLTDDTIGGFNSVLKEHAEKEGEILVTTYLFSDHSTMIHDRIPIMEVSRMTRREYRAGGCTALIDALGQGIRHIAEIHHYSRSEDVPEKTIFVITTDGYENASHQFSAAQVREMIRHEQEKYGWEFIFLAANIDAVQTAEAYGIRSNRAVNYVPDKQGTEAAYESMNMVIQAVRMGSNLDSEASWRTEVDKDFKKRKK